VLEVETVGSVKPRRVPPRPKPGRGLTAHSGGGARGGDTVASECSRRRAVDAAVRHSSALRRPLTLFNAPRANPDGPVGSGPSGFARACGGAGKIRSEDAGRAKRLDSPLGAVVDVLVGTNYDDEANGVRFVHAVDGPEGAAAHDGEFKGTKVVEGAFQDMTSERVSLQPAQRFTDLLAVLA
jgi:hypothetical protein